MPIKVRNLSKSPFSPISASALRSNNWIVTLPPSNAVAIANSQSFTSLASNALATPNRGLTNPILLNGSGIFAVLDPGAIDYGVYLPLPCCPVITNSVAGSTYTVRWRGINHLGRPVNITETKSQTVAADAPTFFQSQIAFSYIESCEILTFSGAGAETFTIGYVWDFGAGGTAAYAKRVQLPYESSLIAHVIGMNIIELGGAVWTDVAAWAVGSLIATQTTADRAGYLATPDFGTALFNMGRTSTNPTTPFRVIISQLPHTKNIYHDDAVPGVTRS